MQTQRAMGVGVPSLESEFDLLMTNEKTGIAKNETLHREGEILIRISFMNIQNSQSHDGKRTCKDLLFPA